MTFTETIRVETYSDNASWNVGLPLPDDEAAKYLPAGLMTLWGEVKRLRAVANDASLAYGVAITAVEGARRADLDAATAALRSGNPDPGPVAETEAMATIATAKRKAEVAYKASHDAGTELVVALGNIDRAALAGVFMQLHDEAANRVRQHVEAARSARGDAYMWRTTVEWTATAPKGAQIPGVDSIGPWLSIERQSDNDLRAIALAGRPDRSSVIEGRFGTSSDVALGDDAA